MGGCSAEFCNNSSSKGYIMKVFPRNRKRRVIWAKNVGRKDWTPTNNSCLCEIHFASDMWQQRFDAKRKLKKDAVPTIFGFFLKKKNVVDNNVSNNPSIKNNKSQDVGCEIIMNTSESSLLAENNDANDDVPDNISNNQLINNKSQDVGCEIIMNTSESLLLAENNDANDDVPDNISNNQLINNKSQDVGCEIITSESSCMTCMNLRKNSQCKKTAEVINKQYLQIINMRRKMKAQRKTIQTLQTKIKNDKYKTALTSIFDEDQIQTLITKKRSRNWSHKTIQRALQIKFVCGRNGYDHLIQQGYPLPSLRTLRRK